MLPSRRWHYGRRYRLPVRKGVPVVMKDISDKSLTLGMTEAAKLLNKQLERGKIDGLKLAGVISTIQPTRNTAVLIASTWLLKRWSKTRK